MNHSSSGRGWAYAGALLGGAVSIAANFAHSYVPPKGAPATWAPQPGAVIGAIIWPVFLFVAVEILARVAWPHGPSWQLLRFGGIAPVAFVAALVSYRHLSGLLAFYGEEAIVCILGPLAVDGLMVMATGAILATGQHQHTIPTPTPNPTPATPTPSTAASPDALIGTPNLDPVKEPAPITATAVPSPVTTVTPTSATPAPAAPAVPHRADPVNQPAARTEIPTPAEVAARVTPATTSTPPRPAAIRPGTAGTSKPQPRKTAPTVAAKPRPAPAADIPVTEPELEQLPLPYTVDPALLVKAREIATQYRTETGNPITANQLAARARVNSDLAAQALAVLDLGPDSPTQPIPAVNGTPVKAHR
jgi:hypothetical protein